MTNKQTIVNGVDVSECEFYWLEKDLCNNGNLTGDCQENKDCIYKRYIRKEQECEELNNTITNLENIRDEFSTKLDQLKSENEDLKKSILQECPNCGEEYLNYKGVELYYENNDLKQTLAEIKEIAEWHTTKADSEDVQEDMKQILQKISEVENEHNG